MRTLNALISRPWLMVLIYVVFALAAGIQSILITLHAPKGAETQYTSYNNYVIFKSSFDHLVEGKDLYTLYPEQHHDLFKYTPTFAFFFGIFAILPDWLGLNLWNLLNALALVLGVSLLPVLTRSQKGVILLLCSIDMLTNFQNDQSNGMIAGMLILAFSLLQDKRYALATLCIVSTAFIKIIGIGACLLFLFYPQKWKLMLLTLLWAVLLSSVPLLVVDIRQYTFLLSSWFTLLSGDHSSSLGFSVMGLIHAWFGVSAKFIIVLTGLLLLLMPFLRTQMYQVTRFRVYALAAILIWIVIFNHKAESNSFILAMAGAALWFVSAPKNALNIILIVLAILLATLSPSDLYPKALREQFIEPYVLKALPYILIWVKIEFDMMVMKEGAENNE